MSGLNSIRMLCRSTLRQRITLSKLITSPSETKSAICRSYSWISAAPEEKQSEQNATTSTDTSHLDPEKIFAMPETQDILKKLSVIEVDRLRQAQSEVIRRPARPFYRLATEEEVDQLIEKTVESAKLRIQFPPMMNPHTSEPQIISEDEEIADLDNAKFVFTDISPGISDRDRTVVVRDSAGTLREATFEEKWRMIRLFYPKERKPIDHPPVFFGDNLENALVEGHHRHILDFACHQFEPEDPEFVRVCCRVFDDLVQTGNFETLMATRHFGNFALYLALNKNLDGLILWFAKQRNFKMTTLLIDLYKICHKVTLSRISTDFDSPDISLFQSYTSTCAKHKKQELESVLSEMQSFSGAVQGKSTQNKKKKKKSKK